MVMLVVRGGLTGNAVLKLDTTSLTPHDLAVAVVTLGWVRRGAIVAVRPARSARAAPPPGPLATS